MIQLVRGGPNGHGSRDPLHSESRFPSSASVKPHGQGVERVHAEIATKFGHLLIQYDGDK